MAEEDIRWIGHGLLQLGKQSGVRVNESVSTPNIPKSTPYDALRHFDGWRDGVNVRGAVEIHDNPP